MTNCAHTFKTNLGIFFIHQTRRNFYLFIYTELKLKERKRTTDLNAQLERGFKKLSIKPL